MNDLQKLIDAFNSRRFQGADVVIKKSFEESLERIKAATQPYLDVIQDLAANYDLYKGTINRLFGTTKAYDVADKLGKNQFVLLDSMPEQFVDEVYQLSENDYTDIDDAITRLLISEEEGQQLIEKIKQDKLLESNKVLVQSEAAYLRCDYDLAILGFTAVLDGLLSVCTNIQSIRFDKRLAKLEDDAGENAMVDLDVKEFAVITTFVDAITTFVEHHDFTDDEPDSLNRNWIMHGRRKRPVTKLDCVKVLHMIYGTLKMKELADKDSENDDADNK